MFGLIEQRHNIWTESELSVTEEGEKMCSCLLDALRRSVMIQSWLWGHPDRLDHRTIDLVSAKN